MTATARKRFTLGDERGPFAYQVDGLDVDIPALLKALSRTGRAGLPVAHGPCGVAIRLYSSSAVCNGSVIVTQAGWDGAEWIHASIAREQSVPSYADLARLKHGVFGPDRYAFQVFAPAGRHVNIHEHAPHLWGRADGKSVLPDFGQHGTI